LANLPQYTGLKFFFMSLIVSDMCKKHDFGQWQQDWQDRCILTPLVLLPKWVSRGGMMSQWSSKFAYREKPIKVNGCHPSTADEILFSMAISGL
jgi:hypothetical protein